MSTSATSQEPRQVKGTYSQGATPLLLRRIQPRAVAPDVVMNMTVVTSNRQPEMSDQVEDATAPRNDQ